ncbi:BppU family phage baseplate upper protein, partial [Ruminococcus bromii]|uniref:BppU family phage baseplate upper protein n=1 Tax=Ruminococcus bromii TaxID=40518 RepID=UPI00241E2F66
MKSRTMKFTLDCSKVGNQLCIDGIRQGDANSIVFIISLANGINLLDVVAGNEESVVVTMYGKKPDGTTIVRDCGINEDGNITYTIHTQDTTCVGIVSYQLVVTSTREKILASPVFSTMVEERNLVKTYTVLTTQPDDWVDGYDKYYYYENGRFYKLNRFERESAPEWVINKYYSVNDNEVESTSDFDALAYALLRAKQYSDRTEEYLAEVKKKADKASTLDGYGITDAIKNATGTVRAINLADDVINKFGEKVNSSELFDVTKSINLA